MVLRCTGYLYVISACAARSEKVRNELVGFPFVDGREDRIINSVSYDARALEWVASANIARQW